MLVRFLQKLPVLILRNLVGMMVVGFLCCCCTIALVFALVEWSGVAMWNRHPSGASGCRLQEEATENRHSGGGAPKAGASVRRGVLWASSNIDSGGRGAAAAKCRCHSKVRT